MPFDVRLVDDGKGAIYTGSGVLTGRDIQDTVIAMLDADEKLAALRYALVDLTGIERSEVATDDLRVISEMVKGAKAKLSKRCMAIAATSDLAFGLARMYSAFVPGVGWEVGVFKDLAKAHSYIESNVGERFSFGVEHDSICETG